MTSSLLGMIKDSLTIEISTSPEAGAVRLYKLYAKEHSAGLVWLVYRKCTVAWIYYIGHLSAGVEYSSGEHGAVQLYSLLLLN